MKEKLPCPLRGVIPPMVTPLSDLDVLDVEGLEKLIEHIIGGGVNGLFILGTTGEAPSLSYRLRRELIERACRQVAGRVPVLVGVTDASVVETQRVASHAADAGAAAVVMAPPFYYPIDETDLTAYFRAVVPQLPLPVFLYNMPTHTKFNFTPGIVRRAMSMEKIVGLKDSAPGATCFKAVRPQVLSERPDFALLIGPEELMSDCVKLGAHGGVTGGANAFPRLFVDLYDATIRGDEPEIARLQSLVIKLSQTVYRAAGSTGYASIGGIKQALACMKICRSQLAPPLRNLQADEQQAVGRAVAAIHEAISQTAATVG